MDVFTTASEICGQLECRSSVRKRGKARMVTGEGVVKTALYVNGYDAPDGIYTWYVLVVDLSRIKVWANPLRLHFDDLSFPKQEVKIDPASIHAEWNWTNPTTTAGTITLRLKDGDPRPRALVIRFTDIQPTK